MISEKIQSIISEYKPQLPDYIQETLDSFDWLATAEEIAAKYRLTPKQVDSFLAEVVMLLFEISDASLFKLNLVNHIGVSEVIAQSLIMDINARIVKRLETEQARVVGDAPELLKVTLQKDEQIPNVDVHPFAQGMPMYQPQATNNQGSSSVSGGDPYRESID
jgi:hypothetical protein